MNQSQVEAFHRTFGCTIGNWSNPSIADSELRIELLQEEVKEFAEAVENNDLIKAVDGLCDIIYVALGAAVTFGVDISECFDEVHRSNMTKVGGYKREDGKWMKPDGWEPPNLEAVLEKQKKLEV